MVARACHNAASRTTSRRQSVHEGGEPSESCAMRRTLEALDRSIMQYEPLRAAFEEVSPHLSNLLIRSMRVCSAASAANALIGIEANRSVEI